MAPKLRNEAAYIRSFLEFMLYAQRRYHYVTPPPSFISQHGVAMSRGLYFTAMFFFLLLHSFFRRLISEVTKRISTKLGHIFTYDCYVEVWSKLPGHLPPRAAGKKPRLLGQTLNFDRTYLCKET